MRTKLLRALAHLKAAAEHVAAARAVLGYHDRETAAKLIPLAGAVADTLKIVGAEYARQVVRALVPAVLR